MGIYLVEKKIVFDGKYIVVYKSGIGSQFRDPYNYYYSLYIRQRDGTFMNLCHQVRSLDIAREMAIGIEKSISSGILNITVFGDIDPV